LAFGVLVDQKLTLSPKGFFDLLDGGEFHRGGKVSAGSCPACGAR
jgi:hypothetical protein